MTENLLTDFLADIIELHVRRRATTYASSPMRAILTVSDR